MVTQLKCIRSSNEIIALWMEIFGEARSRTHVQNVWIATEKKEHISSVIVSNVLVNIWNEYITAESDNYIVRLYKLIFRIAFVRNKY